MSSRQRRKARRTAEQVHNDERAQLHSRGVRNNNPGNIRKGDNWQGSTGDDGEFVVFESPKWGFRAASKVLDAYAERGITQTRRIIDTWAPRSENHNNDQYIQFVSDRVKGLRGQARREQLLLAIARFETGQDWDIADVREGIALA